MRRFKFGEQFGLGEQLITAGAILGLAGGVDQIANQGRVLAMINGSLAEKVAEVNQREMTPKDAETPLDICARLSPIGSKDVAVETSYNKKEEIEQTCLAGGNNFLSYIPMKKGQESPASEIALARLRQEVKTSGKSTIYFRADGATGRMTESGQSIPNKDGNTWVPCKDSVASPIPNKQI